MKMDLLAFRVLHVIITSILASSQALQAAIANKSLNREPGFGYAYFVRHPNSKLEGENPRQYHAPTYKPCAVACTKNMTCLSFNFGKKPIFFHQGQAQYLCELLSTDKYNSSSKYLNKSLDFDHYSIRSNCSKSPCLHNFTCIANYTEDTYDCSCPRPSYEGKHCKDVDECRTEQHDCSPNATCTNIIGSYNCKCKDGYSGNGTTCIVATNSGEKWLKINTDPVCFGAGAFGHFHITNTGTVTIVKLVHRSGFVACSTNENGRSNWGCMMFGNFMNTILTDNKDNKLLPQDEFIEDTRYYKYYISGFTPISPELVFGNFSTPMAVTAGQEYRIWYGQDLTKYDDNNQGPSCIDVYMYGLFGF